MYAYSVNIWIKYSNFIKVSKQIKIDNGIDNDKDIYNYACYLFDKLWDKDSTIRGLCVGVSNISRNHDTQLSLFNNNSNNIDNSKDKKLQEAMDKIKSKYGDNMIIYADMIDKKQYYNIFIILFIKLSLTNSSSNILIENVLLPA